LKVARRVEGRASHFAGFFIHVGGLIFGDRFNGVASGASSSRT
jgi:hypothetical protein